MENTIEIKIVNGKAVAMNEFSAIVMDMIINDGEGDVTTFKMSADKLDDYLPRLVRAGFRVRIIPETIKEVKAETVATVKNIRGGEFKMNGDFFKVAECGNKNAIIKRIHGGGLTRIKTNSFLKMANSGKIIFCN